MTIVQIPPLAPVYWLLFGAFLILIVSPVAAARQRHHILVVISVLAGLSVLAMAISGRPADGQDVRVLAEWLGQPALALASPVGQPLIWMLLVWLLAVNLAWYERADLCPALEQALLLMMVAAAYGLMLAGSYRTLAFGWLAMQAVAALFFLARGLSDRMVARLLLGVVGGAGVMLVTGGRDVTAGSSLYLGSLFSLMVWLQLGLYPLLESADVPGTVPAVRLVWTGVNLLIGVYLISTGAASWIAWPAAVTSLLHGLLAWLESSRERALAHAGYCLVGGMLITAALGGDSLLVRSGAVSVLMAFLALSVTPVRLGDGAWPPATSGVSRYAAYLPPLLASLVWLGVPLSPGWSARISFYQVVWNNGGPVMLAVVSVGQGAALSVLYRYWRLLLQREAAGQPRAWQLLAAGLAALPWLIPLLAEQVLASVSPTTLASGDMHIGLVEGFSLAGVWLWLVFLGYGRDWLLSLVALPRPRLSDWLRAGWLTGKIAQLLDVIGRVVLRARAVVEGEHYLAWAIILTVCLVLWALTNPFDLQP